ncbi:MAG: AAA family ATPase [Planctomycetes bacterium]|nr:AAA family ATPase [Planctomycetota bacterium]
MNRRAFFARDVRSALAAVEREFGPDARIVATEQEAQGVRIVAEPPMLAVAGTEADDWRARATAFGLPVAMLAAVARELRGVPEGARAMRAADRLAQRILTVPPFASRTVALVGPTGVGKTTTIAKLAACAQQSGLSVRLLTLDVARPGGVEQLRSFAQTLGLDVAVATTSRELEGLASDVRRGELVLVDTAGRAPHDRAARTATIDALRGAGASVMLCLQASARRTDASATLAAWKQAAPASLVVTKWDETGSPGEVVALAIERELPIAWITTGQTVPGDLVAADAVALAAHAVGLSEEQARSLVR